MSIGNIANKQRDESLAMLLGLLAPSLVGNILESKRIIRGGKGAIRANQGF